MQKKTHIRCALGMTEKEQ